MTASQSSAAPMKPSSAFCGPTWTHWSSAISWCVRTAHDPEKRSDPAPSFDMQILLLIIQFPPDVNSTGILMAKLCAGLQARGHQISVLTSFPHYEKFRVWSEYRGKVAQRAYENRMDVLRLCVYASGAKQRMSHRLLSYLSFCAMATIAGIVSRRSHDVILCTNGSFFSGVAAFLIGH